MINYESSVVNTCYGEPINYCFSYFSNNELPLAKSEIYDSSQFSAVLRYIVYDDGKTWSKTWYHHTRENIERMDYELRGSIRPERLNLVRSRP